MSDEPQRLSESDLAQYEAIAMAQDRVVITDTELLELIRAYRATGQALEEGGE